MNKDEFRKTLIRARHEKNITQARLAALSGVGANTIARIETGIQGPRLENAELLLRALGLTLAAVKREG